MLRRFKPASNGDPAPQIHPILLVNLIFGPLLNMLRIEPAAKNIHSWDIETQRAFAKDFAKNLKIACSNHRTDYLMENTCVVPFLITLGVPEKAQINAQQASNIDLDQMLDTILSPHESLYYFGSSARFLILNELNQYQPYNWMLPILELVIDELCTICKSKHSPLQMEQSFARGTTPHEKSLRAWISAISMYKIHPNFSYLDPRSPGLKLEFKQTLFTILHHFDKYGLAITKSAGKYKLTYRTDQLFLDDRLTVEVRTLYLQSATQIYTTLLSDNLSLMVVRNIYAQLFPMTKANVDNVIVALFAYSIGGFLFDMQAILPSEHPYKQVLATFMNFFKSLRAPTQFPLLFPLEDSALQQVIQLMQST